ncbi:MAG: universal stress protein [Roseinatronobacter sp.]
MYRSIVIAAALFNHGATTRKLIEKANVLVDPEGAITLVHVLDEIPHYLAASVTQDQIMDHRKALRAQLTSLAASAKATRVDIDVRGGTAPEQILECARETHADLIMIASHKPGLSDYFIGSTASRVVRHAQTSVLVVR